MAKDRLLELAESRAGFQPEILVEHPPGLAVRR